MNAQQLKNAILQEAIEGRLVPQDPNDEPASVLLERIREEKKRLVKEGKLKKKDLEETPISEDEKPFEIPESWEWCRVFDITDSYIGLTYKPTDVSTNGWVVLRSSNIQDGLLDYNDIVRVNMDIPEKLRVQVNDIIICARNGSKKLVGKSALVREVNEPTTFGAFMAICRTQFYEYMAKYLLSPLFFQQLRKDSDTTTINQLTQKTFNRYLVPLPPLAEQKRIVAKIEELLPKVEEFGKAQEALDKLNEELPDRLKKSILQEAITGRLVPQDPNDEPASVLLDKIRAEKKQLVKEGKFKKKDLEETPISEDEKPFEIPESWEWVRWGTLSESIQYGYNTPAKEKGRIKMVRISDIQNGVIAWTTTPYCDIDEQDIDAYKLKKNDILFARTGGTVGKSYLVSEEPQEAIYAGYLIRTRYSCQLCPQYLKMFMDSSLYWEQLKDGTIATAQPNCNGQKLAKMILPLPPLAEQKRIVAKIEEVFKEIDKLKK
jgi:type I restriction enzyme S subunit